MAKRSNVADVLGSGSVLTASNSDALYSTSFITFENFAARSELVVAVLTVLLLASAALAFLLCSTKALATYRTWKRPKFAPLHPKTLWLCMVSTLTCLAASTVLVVVNPAIDPLFPMVAFTAASTLLVVFVASWLFNGELTLAVLTSFLQIGVMCYHTVLVSAVFYASANLSMLAIVTAFYPLGIVGLQWMSTELVAAIKEMGWDAKRAQSLVAAFDNGDRRKRVVRKPPQAVIASSTSSAVAAKTRK